MNGLTNCASGSGSAPDICAPEAIAAAEGSAATEDATLVSNADPIAPPNTDTSSGPGIEPNPDSWRAEVAARVERYRNRRKPRTPRYPSLLLPFDAPESWARPATLGGSGANLLATAPMPREQGFAFSTSDGRTQEMPVLGASGLAEVREMSSGYASQPQPDQPPEPARIIEFPRSAAIPIFHRGELADPVFNHDCPRIVEAPEILPPPPALGGILIEPALPESPVRDSDLVSIIPSASISRRALAALVDGAILMVFVAVFAAIFFRLNPSLRFDPSLPARETLLLAAGALGIVVILLGAAYEFLFVVYSGITPGLRVARLQLASFDGSAPDRRARRRRVLASFLSAFSAGLGYFWCVLDQNGLCWHDRITRTLIRTATKAE